jgi:hypothetical protein
MDLIMLLIGGGSLLTASSVLWHRHVAMPALARLRD